MHYPKLSLCFMAHTIICIQGNPFSVWLLTCRQNGDSFTVSLNSPGESVLSLSLHCFIEKCDISGEYPYGTSLEMGSSKIIIFLLH